MRTKGCEVITLVPGLVRVRPFVDCAEMVLARTNGQAEVCV